MARLRLVRFLLTLTMLFVLTPTLRAQLNRGTIEGIVTDPQGAVVPNVTVTITSIATGVATNLKTNSAGSYLAVGLVPGVFSARFEASGFASLDLTDIQVPAGTVTRVDTQLRIGETRQTVEVKAGIVLVDTAASNISATLGSRMIDDVPLQGRDLQQLVFLVPGINSVSGPPGSNFGFSSQFGSIPDPTNVLGSNLSVNGGEGGANAWYLDGSLNLSSFAENAVISPSPDSVAEFQVITNAYAPEYSRTGGGVFNVVLKSGTNALHGDIYEYTRQSGLNARNPFTSVGVDPITGKSGIIKDRQMHYNDFGGALGGPVYLPKIYDGRNKTFFFVSVDPRILHLLGQKVFTVPTALMRQGDFSEDPNISRGLWDPYSTIGPADDGTFARSAFGTPLVTNGCSGSIIGDPSNPGKSTSFNPTSATCAFATQIPANRIDPVASFFMSSYPLPNYRSPLSASCTADATGQHGICNNFLGGNGTSQVSDNISIKIDHEWSSKSKYFFEWLGFPGRYRNFRVPWTGPTYPASAVGYGSAVPMNFRSQIAGMGYTRTFSPTLINEFRYSFSRQLLDALSGTNTVMNQLGDLKQVEEKLAPVQLPSSAFNPTPAFGISSPGGGSMSFGIPAWQNANAMSEAHNIVESLTDVMGRHTIKTGFVYRLEHTGWNSSYPTNLNFSGGIARNPVSNLGAGGGLEQFLLGAVSDGDYVQSGLFFGPYERYRYWGFFWQDDFRVTKSLSVNFGLRYDLYGWPKMRWTPQSKFCEGCVNPASGLVGTVLYEGDPGYPKGSDMFPANKTNIEPRFNFSWAPFANSKTIVRGGYNIFTSNGVTTENAPGQFNQPLWQVANNWSGSFYPNQCPAYSGQCVAFPLSDTTTNKSALTNPPLTAGLPTVTRSQGFGTNLGTQYVAPISRDPLVQMWGIEIQRELPGNMMLSVGYVGNHGTHLFGEPFRSMNYVHTADKLKYRSTLNDLVPITDYYSGQTAQAFQDTYGSADLPRSILISDYPLYLGLGKKAYDGTGIYHGLNVRLQKRYAHGLNLNIAYTWSKAMTNALASNTGILIVDAIHTVGTPGGRSTYALNTGGIAGYQDRDNMRDHTISMDDIPHMLNVTGSYEIPIGKGHAFLNQGGIVNGILGGWKLSANLNAQSGIPLNINCPGNQMTSRCDMIGNPQLPGGRSRAEKIADWINPAAFVPAFGTDQSFWANYTPNDDRAWLFGTAGPRLPQIRTPGFWNVDSSLFKQFKVKETKYFEFRWELFNALNHQNLGTPNNNFCLPAAADGSTDLVHQAGCSFGRITNIQTDPRAMEFALKFYW